MHSLTLFLLAFLATVALGAPAPSVTLNKRTFKVPRVRRSGYTRTPICGTAALLKASRKYGLDLVDAAATNMTAMMKAASENGVVSALPEENASEFLSPVQIGGQTLSMDFDTGSSDLWVFSTQLSQRVIGQHTAYDPTKSSTFQKIQGATWRISYGDGSSASGNVGTDVVDIGGATVTKQAVEMATALSSSFTADTNNDGLVGLAFSRLNTVRPTRQKTFFDNVMPNLDQPLFTADLGESTGTYEFGAIDGSKFKGELSYVDVDAASGFWQFASPFVTIGGQRVSNAGGSPAIADTGTSLLIVDDAVAAAYYARVPGAAQSADVGGYVYPCGAKLPDFGVAVGADYTAVVPGSMVTFAQVDRTRCFGGVQGNGGAGLQIYGDVLFRTQFVVFDGGKARLGWAPKN